MLVASWLVFALLAALWTLGAWLAAGMARWLADALASGSAVQAARDAASWPVPDWMRIWVDPGWVEALQSFLRWAIDAGSAVLPAAGSAAGWLVPLVWVGWAVGAALLLAGAVAAHFVLRRFARRP